MGVSDADDGQQRARDLAGRFEQLTGSSPAGVFAAPGRVNLIGEHTDYNDGFVLPVAIEQQALVAARFGTSGGLRIWSDELGYVEINPSELMPRQVEGWSSYVAGALWAAGYTAEKAGGADILLSSAVPVGAGLSSSAAVECATVLAATTLLGRVGSPQQLAMLAHKAEFEFVGMPCGIMDQMISMCGRAEHALFLDCRSHESELIPVCLSESNLELLVVDTRAPHQLKDGAYAERRQACELAAAKLGLKALRDASEAVLEANQGKLDPRTYRRARHVVAENARVLQAADLLRSGHPDSLGPLLSASHNSLRDDFEVTVPELDTAQEVALASGALGARMVGGGFGGSVLALVRAGDGERVAAAISKAFAVRGFAPPQAYSAQVGDGARQLL